VATHIIGDIHGCYRELCELLDALAPTSADRLVFVGDLVVRGPENAAVVRMFLDDELPNSTVLLGNNEEKIRPTLEGDPTYATPAVHHTIQQLREASLLDAALELFSTFPLYTDAGDDLVVHAGIRPGVPLERQTRSDLVNIKSVGPDPTGPMWWESYHDPRRIIFGHHVFRDPLVLPNAIGIDTGCVYGGSLTALTLETGTFTSVRAAETYYRHPGKWHLFV
jgi:serine/threonine protein phosphatase 1